MQISQRKDYDLPDNFPTVETLTSTSFLTVESDPAAEETWNQFRCNDTVRLTSPDFLKSLQQMFAEKPAGQYLVKVVATLELSELDFEPQKEPTTAGMEDADDWCNANHTAGRPVESAGQVEALETSTPPWTEDVQPEPVGAESDDFEL